MLRIFIPGVFFSTNIGFALEAFKIELPLNLDSSAYNTIYFVILSIILGLFVYSLDIPKRVSFFQRELPTKRIKAKHPSFDLVKVSNSYFTFYDNLSTEFKLKNEIYSGFYHFCINLSSISFFVFIASLIIDWCVLSELILANSFIFIVSLATALILYFGRLKFTFQRHLQAYFASEEYKNLIKP